MPDERNGTLCAMKTVNPSPASLGIFRSQRALVGIFALIVLAPGSGLARELSNYAADMREDLTEKILPYWCDTTLDRTNGGYVLADDVQNQRPATEKQIVTQSRLIWTFSRVHLKGFGDENHSYLKVAEHGYRFLMEHFLDRKNGGYFFGTHVPGEGVKDAQNLLRET